MGAIGIGVAACCLCTCGGTGVRYFTTNGAIPFVRPNIVGKWEPANIGFGYEFKSDGTGDLIQSKNNKYDFKWHIEGYSKPVLILDFTQSKKIKEMGAFGEIMEGLIGGRRHYHFKIEDDSLVLTSLQPNIPPLVLRRATADSPSKKDKAAPEIAGKKGDSSPEFDANDFERTTKWAVDAEEKHQKLQSNQIALADSIKKFNNESRRHVGKKILWSIPVRKVTETEAVLETGFAFPFGEPKLLDLRKENANPPFWSLSLIVGKEITRDRAAQLKQKTIVHVKGTIREVSIDEKSATHAGGGRVVIVIGDVQGE